MKPPIRTFVFISDLSQRFRYVLEMCFVVSLVFLLTAVAISEQRRAMVIAQVSESLALVSGHRNELVVFRAHTGEWPAGLDNSDLAGVNSRGPHGKYVESVSFVEPGVVHMTFNDEASPELKDRTLTYTSVATSQDTGAPIVLRCSQRAAANADILDDVFLPRICRSQD